MPVRVGLLAVLLLSACREAASPAPELRADVHSAPSPDAVTREGLPPLPGDMVVELGEVYESVASKHAAPKPSLDAPLATIAEHQVWLDRELEPWRDSLRGVGEQLNATRPQLPEGDASDVDAALARHERLRLVHAALSATIELDESITRVRVPIPDESRPNGVVADEGKRYMAMFLADELDGADFWRTTCTQYASGYEPVPTELEPWARHCRRCSTS